MRPKGAPGSLELLQMASEAEEKARSGAIKKNINRPIKKIKKHRIKRQKNNIISLILK
jgi:hypothetical protein